MLLRESILVELTAKAKQSPRLRMNYNLHESPEDSVQRMFNAIEPGSIIPIARHSETNETLILLRGRLKVLVFDEQGTVIEECVLDLHKGNFGYHIPKGVWHSVESLESGTVMFETREGPYVPLSEKDILKIDISSKK